MTQIMKPTKELLELAKVKAIKLEPRQQIRLGGGDYKISYWIMKDADGSAYIGWRTDDGTLSKFFLRKPVYKVIGGETDELIGEFQRLM